MESDMGKTANTAAAVATATKPATAAAAAAAHQPTVLPVDEWHGVGGEYVIENGVRRRVGGPPLPSEQVAPAADQAEA